MGALVPSAARSIFESAISVGPVYVRLIVRFVRVVDPQTHKFEVLQEQLAGMRDMRGHRDACSFRVLLAKRLEDFVVIYDRTVMLFLRELRDLGLGGIEDAPRHEPNADVE